MKNKKERIIADSYDKERDPVFGDDLKCEFNIRIAAINQMYGWLYEQGILKKASFEFKDYSEATYFAIDAKALAPYRKAMEASGVPNANIAVHHIFDEFYTPCLYSGAISLSWPMLTYREVDGVTHRSCECEYIREMRTSAAIDVGAIALEKGPKAAISEAFRLLEFEPSDL